MGDVTTGSEERKEAGSNREDGLEGGDEDKGVCVCVCVPTQARYRRGIKTSPFMDFTTVVQSVKLASRWASVQ